jgi:hypothetical protein
MPNTELESLQVNKNRRILSDKGDLPKKSSRGEKSKFKAKHLVGMKN